MIQTVRGDACLPVPGLAKARKGLDGLCVHLPQRNSGGSNKGPHSSDFVGLLAGVKHNSK